METIGLAAIIIVAALLKVFAKAFGIARKDNRNLIEVLKEYRTGFIEAGFFGFVIAVLFYFNVLQDFLSLAGATFDVTNVVTAVLLGISADEICYRFMVIFRGDQSKK